MLRATYSSARSPFSSPRSASTAAAAGTHVGVCSEITPISFEPDFNQANTTSTGLQGMQTAAGSNSGALVTLGAAHVVHEDGSVGGAAVPTVAAPGETPGSSSKGETSSNSTAGVLSVLPLHSLVESGVHDSHGGRPWEHATIAQLIRAAQGAGFAPLLDPFLPRSSDLSYPPPAAEPTGGSALHGTTTSYTPWDLQTLRGGAAAAAVGGATAAPLQSDSDVSNAAGVSEWGLLSSRARGAARLNDVGLDRGYTSGAGGVSEGESDSDEVALCLGYHAMLD
jgi:hypothetical protein